MAQAQRKATAKRGVRKSTKATTGNVSSHTPPEWMPRGHSDVPQWQMFRVRRGVFSRTNFNAFERDKHERLAADLTISQNLFKGGRSMSGTPVEQPTGGPVQLVCDAQGSPAGCGPEARSLAPNRASNPCMAVVVDVSIPPGPEASASQRSIHFTFGRVFPW